MLKRAFGPACLWMVMFLTGISGCKKDAVPTTAETQAKLLGNWRLSSEVRFRFVSNKFVAGDTAFYAANDSAVFMVNGTADFYIMQYTGADTIQLKSAYFYSVPDPQHISLGNLRYRILHLDNQFFDIYNESVTADTTVDYYLYMRR